MSFRMSYHATRGLFRPLPFLLILLGALLMWGPSVQAADQVIITEIVASNTTGLRDEDGRLPHESEFLRQLGSRVREMRALRGMSRRELARLSGLSERFVAQIEVGKGNVSIVRLLRIALVFRCE